MEIILVWMLLVYADNADSQPTRRIAYESVEKCQYYRSQIRYPAYGVCLPTEVNRKTKRVYK